MSRVLTRTKLVLATLAVAASAGTAFAGEGNGPSFPGNQVPDVVLGQTTVLPAPDGAGGVMTGSTLPTDADKPMAERRQAHEASGTTPACLTWPAYL